MADGATVGCRSKIVERAFSLRPDDGTLVSPVVCGAGDIPFPNDQITVDARTYVVLARHFSLFRLGTKEPAAFQRLRLHCVLTVREPTPE